MGDSALRWAWGTAITSPRVVPDFGAQVQRQIDTVMARTRPPGGSARGPPASSDRTSSARQHPPVSLPSEVRRERATAMTKTAPTFLTRDKSQRIRHNRFHPYDVRDLNRRLAAARINESRSPRRQDGDIRFAI